MYLEKKIAQEQSEREKQLTENEAPVVIQVHTPVQKDNSSEVSIDELEERESGFSDNAQEEQAAKLSDEYNPDDEQDDDSNGEYGYGWPTPDAFDNPEGNSTKEVIDEDERYAQGLDKKK